MAEFEVWKASEHETKSKMLTRSPRAKAMAKALGIRRIKSSTRCASCHFTMTEKNGKPKAMAGVSCESCHGPAGDWIDAHQEFGSKGTLIEDETETHREQREQQCDEAGMIRIGRVHAMAAQCLACHNVNDEELIDVAGHPSGDGFELVAWSQGEVRHNFVRGDKLNVEAPKSRKRMLFIAGQMQEMNFALQALAGAKGGGEFESMNIARAQRAIALLNQASTLTSLPEIETVLQGSADWSIQAGCQELADLVHARVAHCSAVLENRTDGTDLEGLDSLVPSIPSK